MKKVLHLLGYVKNYKKHAALNIFFNVLTTIFSLFSLATVVPLLNILFDTTDKKIPEKEPELKFDSDAVMDYVNYHLSHYIEANDPSYVLMLICAGLITLFVLKNLTRYLALSSLAVIRTGVVRDLRERIYDKVTKLPLSYYTEQRKGNLMSKSTSDVFEVEWSIIGSLELLFKEPINIIIFTGMLFFANWQLTLFVMAVLPVTAFLISRVGKSLKNAAKKGQSKLGEVLSILEETLSGLRIIKAFNAEEEMKAKFDEKNNEHFALMKRLYRKQYLGSPISEVMAVITLAIILLYGGSQILDGDSAFNGSFFIFYIVLFSQLIAPAKAFSDAFVKIQRGNASVERIDEILNADLKITEVATPTPLKAFTGKIEYKNVSFRYEKEWVLKDIDLTIEKGQTVALVGPSGGGKSTLADLLPRFYDVEVGDILLDGVSIKEYGLKELRSLMGIVSQHSILFNDTVINNIKLGTQKAGPRDIRKAAEIANADSFIEQMEEKYATNIGESGGKLSGGQRQRLSIARAVLKNPPILILDEATSALDTESEKLVQDALDNLMQNRTSLVIAHRLSTIQHADKIVVVQNGKIQETGNHQELLENAGVYKKLFDLQTFE